jgi:hypothetical protein
MHITFDSEEKRIRDSNEKRNKKRKVEQHIKKSASWYFRYTFFVPEPQKLRFCNMNSKEGSEKPNGVI